MKTLLLYATKNGATKEIAERISQQLKDVDLFNIEELTEYSLADYDAVIIGSAIYAGSILIKAKQFLQTNLVALQSKKLGFFISGLAEEQATTEIANNFPAELLDKAQATAFLGGIFNPKTANFMERTLMRVIAKNSDYTNTIDEEKIASFIEQFSK